MRKNDSLLSKLDWPLFISFMILVFLGLATVYSVAFNEEHPSIFAFSEKYGKQIIWLGASFFIGLLIFLIDADYYSKIALPVYISVLVLLVIVLFMPPINGARAWLGVGSLGVQPAEFAKIATALLLSKYISELVVKFQTIKTVLTACLILFVPALLIALQPDAGTLVVFSSFLFVMYREGLTFDPIILGVLNTIPGIKFKSTWLGNHFIPVLFVFLFLCIITLVLSNVQFHLWGFPNNTFQGSTGVVLTLGSISLLLLLFIRRISSRRDRPRMILVIALGFLITASISLFVDKAFSGLAKHQRNRIELVLGLKEDPDGGDYNRNRAMAAVGSGGALGKGYMGASVSSIESNHVPESETDFIFCPFAEEWGFLGSIILVATYMFMLLRIIFIAERQRAPFNRIYAYCVAMILFYHFAINIGMNIGFAPVIGIPLPFFSYGGSSILSFCVLVFILLKLDSQRIDVL
jgi:rod shape determining protein RodA